MTSDRCRTGRSVLIADAAVDAMGTTCQPAVVVLDGDRIEATGTPQAIGSTGDAPVTRFDGHVLMPALVNAHTHLDLSGDGCWAQCSDFRAWVGRIRAMRAAMDDAQRQSAVAHGVALSLAGGTMAVGDIVAHPADAALRTLADSTLRGIAFIEAFGLGAMQQDAVDRFASRAGHRIGRLQTGFSPHAPYSCGEEVFAAAAAMAGGVCTHLAETPEEVELLTSGTGAFADMLQLDIGLPEAALPVPGAHPVDHLHVHLHRAMCVHLNCIEPRHAQLLAQARVTACLCPRATRYFGRDVPGPLAMLRDAGVDIALGTDSLLCLDTPDRISTLDEARLLCAAHAVDPIDVLAMITTTAARAIDVEPELVDLRPGPTAGVLALPGTSLEDVLRSTAAPKWAAGPF